MLATTTQLPKTAKFLEAKQKPALAQSQPRRVPNKELRAREYLTSHEVEALRKAARGVGRQGRRDGYPGVDDVPPCPQSQRGCSPALRAGRFKIRAAAC